MKTGEFIKVWLPGETPWAEVVAVIGDGRWVGRIANDLVASDPNTLAALAREWFNSDTPLKKLHDHRRGDLIIFERSENPPVVWVPYEPSEQKQH